MILSVLIVLFVLYVVIQVGVFCLRCTGLDKSEAQYEAISLLVGGCSPSISEHPVRRKIGTSMMLIGYLGTAGLIAILIQAVHQATVREIGMTISALAATILITSIGLPERWISRLVSRKVRRHYEKQAPLVHMKLDDTHIVCEVTVTDRMGFNAKHIKDLPFRDIGLMVMAIERDKKTIQLPTGDDRLLTGDRLVLYGDMAGAELLLKAV